jgi:hypothetical protein
MAIVPEITDEEAAEHRRKLAKEHPNLALALYYLERHIEAIEPESPDEDDRFPN